MIQLTEGLQAHDLDYLIMPTVSVDQYESKIDDRKAIVLGIYVTDLDPADRLAGFIERGMVPVLDTEVSPAPTEDGYYIVFVEIDRNQRFVKRLLNLIENISNLTNIDEWKFTPYDTEQEKSYPLTADNINKHVNLDPNSIEIKKKTDKQIAEFLKKSTVDGIIVNENQLTLKTGFNEQHYEIVDFIKYIPTVELTIPELGNRQLTESKILQNLLGYDYNVNLVKGSLMITNSDGALFLKLPYIV